MFPIKFDFPRGRVTLNTVKTSHRHLRQFRLAIVLLERSTMGCGVELLTGSQHIDIIVAGQFTVIRAVLQGRSSIAGQFAQAIARSRADREGRTELPGR